MEMSVTRVVQMFYLRDAQHTRNELWSDYNTCASKYCCKLRHKGINGVHTGVELLYEHTGTPLRYLTQRSPTLRAKRNRKRSVWKIRQNDLAFRINCPVREVLIEIFLGLLITEPNGIWNRGRRRRRNGTMTCDWVLGWNRRFGCHRQGKKKKSRRQS